MYGKYMDDELYLVKGEVFYNLKSYKEAIAAYEKCLEKSRKYDRYCKYSIGYSYMESGVYIKALKYFKELADNVGDYQQKGILNTARLYNKLVQPGEAVNYYKKYIEKVGELTPDIIAEYSDVLFLSGDKNEAFKRLEEAQNEYNDTQEIIVLTEKLADLRRKNDEDDLALSLYDKLISLTKNHQYEYFKGIISFNKSDYDKAIDIFSKLTENDKFGIESTFYLGQSYYLKLQFDKAIEVFSKLLDADDHKIKDKSFFFIAASYYQKKDYDKVLDFIKDNKLLSEDFLEIKRDVLIVQGKYEKAIDVIREILKTTSNQAKNYFLAGQCYYNLSNCERALANFEVAWKKAVNKKLKYSAFFEIAGVYMIQGQQDKALEYYKKIPEDSELYLEAMNKTVDIMRSKENYDEIFELLQKIENIKGEKDYVNYTRGEIYISMNEVDKALKTLDMVSQSSIYNWKSMILRARLLIGSGKNKEAVSLLKKDIDKVPNDFKEEFILEFAKAAYNLKEYDTVIDYIEKMLSNKKDDQFKLSDEIRMVLAQAYLENKNFSQAEANAIFVAEESNDLNFQVKAQFLLGNIYFTFKNYKQAVLEYLKCALLDDSKEYAPKAYLRTAECYQYLKRYDDSVKTYNKVILQYPDSKYSELAKKRIENMEDLPEYDEVDKL
ncbi:MAG: hypothetical protein C0601_05480 [Candidatus Muiribacterium halophilum]|uniref:Uncharacterized protein n=1 Tax=Muiribacterium halophilum TaxID=2053465 RepID=A0A2N5ZHF6_MUIH1|nr:MAG: hypothetical protein C0601_05480 [Candidatus Muirbacterium halophilum]